LCRSTSSGSPSLPACRCRSTSSGGPTLRRLRPKEHELRRPVLPCMLLLAAAAWRPSASPSRPKPPTGHAASRRCSRSPTTTQ
jgi:hypothetical protein